MCSQNISLVQEHANLDSVKLEWLSGHAQRMYVRIKFKYTWTNTFPNPRHVHCMQMVLFQYIKEKTHGRFFCWIALSVNVWKERLVLRNYPNSKTQMSKPLVFDVQPLKQSLAILQHVQKFIFRQPGASSKSISLQWKLMISSLHLQDLPLGFLRFWGNVPTLIRKLQIVSHFVVMNAAFVSFGPKSTSVCAPVSSFSKSVWILQRILMPRKCVLTSIARWKDRYWKAATSFPCSLR